MTKFVTGPIIAAGVGIVGLGNKFASMGDEVAKSAMKMGVGTDALQELRHAGDQVGVSSDSMDRALGRLNQRIGRAADGNEKYQDSLIAMGYSLEDIQNGTINTDEAFMKSIQTLHEMENSTEQSAAASELFGTKLARDLMPAIVAGGDEIEGLRGRAHELGIVMSGESIDAAVAYQDSMDDLKKAFQGAFQEIATKIIPILVDDLIPAIQENVIPLVQEFGERIGGLIEWFTNLSPTTQRYIGLAIALAAALGPILIVVGKVIAAVGALIPALKIVGAVIGSLFSPIGLIIVAIGLFVAGIIWLYKENEEFRNKINGIWEKIKGIFTKVFDAIMDVVDEFVKIATDLWDKYGEDIIERAETAFNAIVDVISWALDLISSILDDFISMFNKFWNKYGEDIVETIELAVEMIISLYDLLFGDLGDGLSGFIELFTSLWEAYGENIQRIAQAFWDFIESVFSTALTALQDVFKIFKALFQGDWNTLWEEVKNLFSNLWDGIKNIFDKWVNFVTEKLEFFTSVFSGAWNAWLNTLKSVFSNIWNYIKNFFNTKINEIRNVAENVLSSIRSAFTERFNAIKNTVSSIINSMKNTVFSVLNSLLNKFRSIGNSIKSVFTGALEGMKGGVKSIMNSIIKIVNGMSSGINKASAVASKVPGVNIPSIPTIPSLATGTNYVPQDTLAQLHKGEEVKPKKYVDRDRKKSNGGVNIVINGLTVLDDYGVDMFMDRMYQRLQEKGGIA